jgi:hypothetical protein
LGDNEKNKKNVSFLENNVLVSFESLPGFVDLRSKAKRTVSSMDDPYP